jgi:tRNA modification GTPase
MAAQLTGVGRSAIAVIGLAGNGSGIVIEKCFRAATGSPMRRGQIRYGHWQSGESIVLTPIAEHHFEIHCHGGPAAIQAILNDLASAGVEVVSSAEFANLLFPEKPLLIQEAEFVLQQCTTEKTAAIALNQVRGSLQDWAMAGLQSEEITTVQDQARQILSSAPFTSRMHSPFRVVLLGPPNVGKSSLTNAIVGYARSITMNTAGTTRDVLHAETVLDGIPIRMSDTAGVRETSDAIEAEGTRRAIREINHADLVIRVRDPETQWIETQKPGSPNDTIDVLNKCDLISSTGDPSPDRANAVLQVSATTGQGMQELRNRISHFFTINLSSDHQPAAINSRQNNCLLAIAESKNQPDVIENLRKLLGIKH